MLLTHWGGDKMADILRTTFSNTFHSMKIIFIQISLKYVPLGAIDNYPVFSEKSGEFYARQISGNCKGILLWVREN